MPSRNRRLPRGQSWPASLTDVIDGLGDAQSLVKQPRFETGMWAGTVLEARWVPSRSFNYGGEGVPPGSAGIYVIVHPVRSTDRVAVRSLVRSQGLPQLREWVEQTQTAAETGRWRHHDGYWRYAAGKLLFAGDRPE
ncbi:hypothetical protein GCM10029978_116280 [Actinoallomurus acanthiterrae]